MQPRGATSTLNMKYYRRDICSILEHKHLLDCIKRRNKTEKIKVGKCWMESISYNIWCEKCREKKGSIQGQDWHTWMDTQEG